MLHGLTSQKIILLVVVADRTSNLRRYASVPHKISGIWDSHSNNGCGVAPGISLIENLTNKYLANANKSFH
jgi:hypothetical protein